MKRLGTFILAYSSTYLPATSGMSFTYTLSQNILSHTSSRSDLCKWGFTRILFSFKYRLLILNYSFSTSKPPLRMYTSSIFIFTTAINVITSYLFCFRTFLFLRYTSHGGFIKLFLLFYIIFHRILTLLFCFIHL